MAKQILNVPEKLQILINSYFSNEYGILQSAIIPVITASEYPNKTSNNTARLLYSFSFLIPIMKTYLQNKVQIAATRVIISCLFLVTLII